jgi:hypothetical protein
VNELLTYPPNYEEIAAAFRIRARHGIIFTYGSTIYNPDRVVITPDLYAHEGVHERQQMAVGGPDAWWRRYIYEDGFRYQQELEAYRAQYRFAQENYGRDQRRALLRHISKALAGPMYGNLVSPAQAKIAITK